MLRPWLFVILVNTVAILGLLAIAFGLMTGIDSISNLDYNLKLIDFRYLKNNK